MDPTVCRIMALRALFKGLGHLFFLKWGPGMYLLANMLDEGMSRAFHPTTEAQLNLLTSRLSVAPTS